MFSPFIETFLTEVYVDESSQTKHRYLVIGGLALSKDQAALLVSEFWKARHPELPQGEMKWEKVSRSKLPAYKRVVELLFSGKRGSFPHYHCIVVDTPRQDHRAFNLGSRDIGFNKEIFQLVRKFGRLYDNHIFHVYLDKRTTSQKTDDLRFILNRHVMRGQPHRDWPYRRLQFRDSAKTELLQFVDIITGGVAYRLNGHHLKADASAAKCELSQMILDRAGIADSTVDTAQTGKFTIWHRQLRSVVS